MASLAQLSDLMRGRRVAVLSGAGLSTESGIPDYRGPQTRLRARKPIQFREFMQDDLTRRRYWARSMVGWPRLRDARPNVGHHAIAKLEQKGIVTGVITQNVDRLHTAAGSKEVIELHGALHDVTCLSCGALRDRDALQVELAARNPQFVIAEAALQPDGDAEIEPAAIESFDVPMCDCGGLLKPRVVYFGESVPRPRVEQAYAMLDAAEVLLVLGSSLTVFSGYRFVLRAKERDKPIAIVNLEETRGDAHATLVIQAPLGSTLSALEASL